MAEGRERAAHLPGCALLSSHVVPFDCEPPNDDLRPISTGRERATDAATDEPSSVTTPSVRGRKQTFVVLHLDPDERAVKVWGPFDTESEADAFGLAHTPVWTIWPLEAPDA